MIARRRFAFAYAIAPLLVAVAGCSGGGGTSVGEPTHFYPAGQQTTALTTVDHAFGSTCTVSIDGAIWYAIPLGQFPAIDFNRLDCAGSAGLDANVVPPLPTWSYTTLPTQAIFVATSLEETYSPQGRQEIETIARSAGVPVTWMIGNAAYLASPNPYNAFHASNGDDIQLEDQSGLYAQATEQFPWFSPTVSVQGAGHERDIATAQRLGNRGFWGITWNSQGTDHTTDLGAPWGTFCSDPASYKRPIADGSCDLVSFEWTARDLTRAALGNTNDEGFSSEAAFSSDPDDVVDRGGFGGPQAAQYLRRLIDAYAAAGVTQPIVVMSQQESDEQYAYKNRDDPLLTALYTEAVASGMKPMTLHDALTAAQGFSSRPRAIAFPYIPGGNVTAYDGVAFTPATIDYHDTSVGLTFVSGHTLPSRVFHYARDPISTYGMPLVDDGPGSASYPTLASVTASGASLAFTFDAPQATRFGIALWSDPAKLGLSGGNVTRAGSGGAVIAFDLPQGRSTQVVPCAACTSTTLPYAI